MTERRFGGHHTMNEPREVKSRLECGLRSITTGHRTRSRRKKGREISVSGLVDHRAVSAWFEDTSRIAASNSGVFAVQVRHIRKKIS